MNKSRKDNDIKWIFTILNLQCSQKNNNINLKRKIDGKPNLYSSWISCGLNTFATIDKKLSGLFKDLI